MQMAMEISDANVAVKTIMTFCSPFVLVHLSFSKKGRAYTRLISLPFL